MANEAKKSSEEGKEKRKQEQCMDTICINAGTEDLEVRKDYVRDLWQFILKESRERPSGAGFVIYGESGLRRRNKIFAKRVFRIFTLDRATW